MNLGALETRFLYINQALWIHTYDSRAQVGVGDELIRM